MFMCASISIKMVDGEEIASADSSFATSVTEKVVSGVYILKCVQILCGKSLLLSVFR